MTDDQDHGQQPQQGYGPRHREGQPWQAGQDHPTAHLPRTDEPRPPYPSPGTPQPGYWEQPGYAPRPGYGQGYPPPRLPGGAPGGPERPKPWAARHKVLTGVLAFCGLVFVVGVAAAAGSSSSSSSPAAATVSPTPKVPVVKARSTARPTPTAAQTATTAAAPSTPAQTTLAAQPAAPATPARTTPAAQPAAPTAPARTTPAPPPSSAPASCHPLSDEGTCYKPGEYCRDSDHGVSGVAGDGEPIICEDNDGWRWEPA